jgi:hypothetical protein
MLGRKALPNHGVSLRSVRREVRRDSEPLSHHFSDCVISLVCQPAITGAEPASSPLSRLGPADSQSNPAELTGFKFHTSRRGPPSQSIQRPE